MQCILRVKYISRSVKVGKHKDTAFNIIHNNIKKF